MQDGIRQLAAADAGIYEEQAGPAVADQHRAGIGVGKHGHQTFLRHKAGNGQRQQGNRRQRVQPAPPETQQRSVQQYDNKKRQAARVSAEGGLTGTEEYSKAANHFISPMNSASEARQRLDGQKQFQRP